MNDETNRETVCQKFAEVINGVLDAQHGETAALVDGFAAAVHRAAEADAEAAARSRAEGEDEKRKDSAWSDFLRAITE